MALFFGVAAQLVGSAAHADELGSQFVSVTPVRFVDTSTGTGGSSSPLGAAATRSYTVPGLPSNATAVLLDVAATSAAVDSSLRIWPYGESMPSGTSVLAIESTQLPDSNSVIVPLGTNKKISVWNGNGNVDFNLDLHGYFVPSDGTAGFHALTAERIVDSPAGLGVTGPTITAGTAYDIRVTGDTIPAGATAIFANIKLSSATVEGGLRVAKGGASLSGLPSALNFDAGVTTDSGITIPLSSAGKLRLASTAASGTVKIYIDVQGYFAPGDGAEFHIGSQQVLVDNLTVSGGEDKTITAAGNAGLPSDGSLGSLALTVFASNWTASGGVSLANPDEGPSNLSNVSFTTSMDAGVGANSTAVVPVSEAGKLVISNKSANAVKVRLTVQGWFDNPDGAEGLVELPTGTSYPGIDSYWLEDLTTIADEEGISVQDAVDKYGWQGEFADAVEQLSEDHPNSFSSAEIDPAGSSSDAVIRFAGSAPADVDTVLQDLPSDVDVDIQESAPYTESELASIQDVATEAATNEVGDSGDVAAAEVDDATGDVHAKIFHLDGPVETDTDDVKESVETALSEDLSPMDTPDVVVTTSNEIGETMTLRGGAAIAPQKDWTLGGMCTSGFPVRALGNSNSKALVTARHCGKGQVWYAGRNTLYDRSQALPLPYGDMQIQKAKGEAVGKTFYYDKKGTAPAKMRVVEGGQKVVKNNKVCMFGRKSGHQLCGYVYDVKRYAVYDDWRNENGVAYRPQNMLWVKMTNGLTQKGDSGGPVFRAGKAVGVISGIMKIDSNGDGTAGAGDITVVVVSPIGEILRMDWVLNS